MAVTPRWSDETTVSEGEVTVTRDLKGNERGILGRLTIRSEADPSVEVHIEDTFPETLSIEATGFKTDHEPDAGGISTERARIKQQVADDPVTISYVLKLSEPPGGVQFDPPSIRDVLRADFTRGNTRAVDGDDAGVQNGDDERTESTAEATGTGRPDTTGARGTTVPRSVEVRLDRLSARVEEFAAYTEALERIVDVRGTAPEILGDIESELDAVDRRLTTVRDAVEGLGDETTAVTAEVEQLAGDVNSVEGDVDALATRLDRVESEVAATRETHSSLAGDISTVADDVAAMRAELDALHTDVEDLLAFRESMADIFDSSDP